MTATRTEEPTSPATPGSETWLPNGFPPPSFVVDTERTRSFAGARGRWLAAAAILGALLLIAGIVLIARDGDNTNVATGSTTTQFGGTNPTFSPTTALDPTATLPNATVPPGGAGPIDPGGGTPVDPSATTPPAAGGGGGGGGGATPPPPAPGTPVGVLAPSTGTLALPKVDATVGPVSGKLGLQNTGAGPLSYSTRSNFGGLTVDRPTGSIPAGGGTELTVTLNGAGAGEGPFNGLLRFEGSGGTQEVRVTTIVGRPPTIADVAGMNCPVENNTCSRQVKPVSGDPAATPCNSQWTFRVRVDDQSQLKAVRAKMAQDVELRINGVPNGPGGIWESAPRPPIAAGTTVTFTIEAIDQLDFVGRSTERRLAC